MSSCRREFGWRLCFAPSIFFSTGMFQCSALLKSFLSDTSSDFGANRFGFLWCPCGGLESSSFEEPSAAAAAAAASVLMYVIGVDFLLAFPRRAVLLDAPCTLVPGSGLKRLHSPRLGGKGTRVSHRTEVIDVRSDTLARFHQPGIPEFHQQKMPVRATVDYALLLPPLPGGGLRVGERGSFNEYVQQIYPPERFVSDCE
uniref:Uncharacterized protein n=1 Tax=Anopheles farauti TaxID=69004 RepID=A0A182Q924_9DIPT